MSPVSPHALFRTAALALLCLVLLPASLHAQFESPALTATRARLNALRPCLPIGDNYLSMLASGLLGGYGATAAPGSYGGGTKGGYGGRIPQPSFSPPPPPPEYLKSLDYDIAACDAAFKSKDKAQRDEILQSIAADIKLKAEDCRQFGMGRKIPVHVFTVRGATPDNGWEVFYKWSGSSLFQTAEIRVPQLTSPATIELPPGTYIFRAQKRTSETLAQNTAPVRIVVGLEKAIDCQLPIQ